jgi:hypothetical protein
MRRVMGWRIQMRLVEVKRGDENEEGKRTGTWDERGRE